MFQECNPYSIINGKGLSGKIRRKKPLRVIRFYFPFFCYSMLLSSALFFIWRNIVYIWAKTSLSRESFCFKRLPYAKIFSSNWSSPEISVPLQILRNSSAFADPLGLKSSMNSSSIPRSAANSFILLPIIFVSRPNFSFIITLPQNPSTLETAPHCCPSNSSMRLVV